MLFNDSLLFLNSKKLTILICYQQFSIFGTCLLVILNWHFFMEKTWRWFGKKDKITLNMLRQIGVEGVVTSLYNIPNGEVWNYETILELKQYIESNGLKWSVVESLPVSEAIKYGGANREALIENYKISLANLGKAGIKTVCYNFMPVIDWVRTDLEYPLEDGTYSLYYNHIHLAYFDCMILKRKNAEQDYSPEVMAKVRALDQIITEAEKSRLIDTIIVKTQGFIHGNIHEGDQNPVEIFRQLLNLYEGIDKNALRENLKHFLSEIMPVCDTYDINMCLHPDDPPAAVFGLPRIVTNDEDITWILNAVDNPHNGLAFCAGSLSAGLQNDVVQLAKKHVSRTHFVHLRSTEILPNGDFVEADHLRGRGNLIELVRIFEKANPNLPMRVDHGKTVLDDKGKGHNPGYPLYGRMYAMAQLDGVMETVKNEIRQGLI